MDCALEEDDDDEDDDGDDDVGVFAMSTPEVDTVGSESGARLPRDGT